MAWKQVTNPNLDPYVYVNGQLLDDWYGWCLATVVYAFSTPYSGPNAWSGWENYTQIKHEDRNWPVGVYFPIWFSGYGGLGHVAIAYVNPNGAMNIWTSPFKHVPYFYTGYNNVDTLANAYLLDSYVGWSEDIAGKLIIENVPDTPVPAPSTQKYQVVENYSPAKLVQLNKPTTYLWGMNYDFDYMVQHPVETHSQGEVWAITNKVQHEDGYFYYRRDGQIDGFNMLDCDDYTPPAPEPAPAPTPTPEDPSPPVEPDPQPVPVPDPPKPDPTPDPTPTPHPIPDPKPEPSSKAVIALIIGALAALVGAIIAVFH